MQEDAEVGVDATDIPLTIFRKWDLYSTGAISEDVLAKVLKDTAFMSREEVHHLFERIDTDDTGTIDYGKFFEWLFSSEVHPVSELLQTCECPDGHKFNIFRPEIDGWCCEECGEDLQPCQNAFQCSECSGLCWCIKCRLQQAGEQVLESVAVAAARNHEALRKVNMPVTDDAQAGCQKIKESAVLHLSISAIAGPLCQVEAHCTWTVARLKSSIEAHTNIPDCAQTLIYDCTALQDNDVLSMLQIPDGADVMMLRRTEQQIEWLTKIRKNAVIRGRGRLLPLLAKAPTEVCADRLIVFEAVSRCGVDLQHASEALRADKEIVVAALKQDFEASAFIAQSLLADRDIALEFVKRNGYFLENLGEDLRADPEVVLAAVNNKGKALRYAADDLLYVRSIVDSAVDQGFCLSATPNPWQFGEYWPLIVAAASAHRTDIKYASKSLLSNRGFAIELLQREPWHLRSIAEELTMDHEVVGTAVENGFSLSDAPSELRANPEVVYVAVQTRGLELKYAAQKLRANRRIVSAAVRNNGFALQYAHLQLRNQKDIVEIAVKQSPSAVQFAGPLGGGHLHQ